MISPFDMHSASTPVIAMKSIGCLRFPKCPRAGGAGRVIYFKGQRAVPWPRENRDVNRRSGISAIDPKLPMSINTHSADPLK
jgi:hypothetical protein